MFATVPTSAQEDCLLKAEPVRLAPRWRPWFRPADGAAFGLPHFKRAARLPVAALIVGDQYRYEFVARPFNQADEAVLQAQIY